MDRLRVVEKTRAFKRKRRDKHNKRATKVRQLEVREGTQYQSDMGFNSSVQESTEQIPQPTIPPQIIQVCTREKEFKKVVFDLETTSRGTFIFKWITVCDHSRKQSAVVTIGLVLSFALSKIHLSGKSPSK